MKFLIIKINFNYLEERKHRRSRYFKTKLDYNNKKNESFKTKRNLITNSAEFYNLSANILMIV